MFHYTIGIHTPCSTILVTLIIINNKMKHKVLEKLKFFKYSVEICLRFVGMLYSIIELKWVQSQ